MVHSINTTIYSILIAIKSGLPTHELKELAEGALLHDLGKIILNESILLKSSALTQEEFNHIKLHPSLGYEALEKKHLLSNVTIYPNGIVVYLSDGTHGIVKAQNPGLLYQPVIRVIDDRDPDGKVSVYDLDLATRQDISIVEP